jgi:DNA-binding CsgD family transcriptional regulator
MQVRLEQGLIRSHTDRLDDPLLTKSIQAWRENAGIAAADGLAAAIQVHCDAATNLYITDIDASNLLGSRMRTVTQGFSLAYAPAFSFGDYPDRSYFESSVIPCVANMIAETQPVFHRIHARVQGKFAVYERLLLPLVGPRGAITSVTVSRLLMLVEPHLGSRPEALSERERQCLHLLTRGYSAKRIAAQLALSQATVENCIERMKSKLGVRSAAQAVAIATLYGTVGSGTEPRVIRDPALTGSTLSGRERLCLGYLGSGLSVRETAIAMNLSAKTVEAQVAALRRKLRARNVTEAMALGIARSYGVSEVNAA